MADPYLLQDDIAAHQEVETAALAVEDLQDGTAESSHN